LIIIPMPQSLSFLLVHLVFSTKDRAPILDPSVHSALHAYLATLARNADCECYGDIDERFYRSVESALDELAALLRGEARELYPSFSGRLASVEQMSNSIGWGFHDFVADVVWHLEEELGPGTGIGAG
jgi:hypothetical protein